MRANHPRRNRTRRPRRNTPSTPVAITAHRQLPTNIGIKMNAPHLKRSLSQRQRKTRTGFTLVELLVVITIIGILAGLALPAILGAVNTAQDAKRKLEVERIASGVEKYYQKYGDYPPDGSDINVIQRHFRRLFPRLHSDDNALLFSLTSSTSGGFSSVAMDRAEALVFFLGGFSDDLSRPLTGPGGPLEFKNYTGDGIRTNIANYQYNLTRSNPMVEFDAGRLDVVLVGSRYVSNDENRYEYDPTALASRGGNDLLPTYLADGAETPLVYFDSRTYGNVGTAAMPAYNGYRVGGEFGAIRPYKTQVGAQEPSGSTYGSAENAMAAVSFQNADKFQIIHPGGDGVFGAAIFDPGSLVVPVHFIAETGDAIRPNASADSFKALKILSGGITISRFNDLLQDSSVSLNGHLDNITNSSTSTIESDLP